MADANEIEMVASELYHDPKNPAFYSSKSTLKKEIEKKLKKKVPLKQVINFLLGEKSFTQYKPRRRFPRLQIKRLEVFESLSCDLGDLQSLKRWNNQKAWLFIAVDNFSHWTYLEGAVDKGKACMTQCFKNLFAALPRHDLPIKYIHTDQG